MTGATTRRRGRPATATRDDVLRLARAQYMDGHKVDVTIVARSLGLGRATIYRWFGSRERLLAEVISIELETLVTRERRAVRQRGAKGLLEVFDRINRRLAESVPLRRFVEQERAGAMRLLTGSNGGVQQRSVAAITEMIATEVATGRYQAPADPQTLAYAIVRLAEAFLYNDAAFGIRGDHERLREVEAALLGLPRPVRRSSRSGAGASTTSARSG
ncbi:MAG TPA: QsdR family transcriptional regulator [Solirubrobacteraceae bacterium]